MLSHAVCKRCESSMAILDILPEGYELICRRCGAREMTERRLAAPPPCFQ